MTEWLRRLLHFGLLLGMCWASSAWAVNYTLPAASFPPCGNSWNSAQNSCSVRVVLQVGDTVTASTPLIIRADTGFELRGNNTLTGVSLQSDYGSVVVESGGQITGSILSNWGTVTLRGTTVSGSVQGLGAMSFTNSEVGGAVSANNAITASGSSFSAGVASSNGAVTLTGGSVQGNISSGCCQVTLTNLSVTGNINVSQNNVLLSNATVTGNITTTNRVELDKSTVYGNVTAATWDKQTIKGTGNSFIYGVCVPATTTPQKLCAEEPAIPQVHHYRLSYSSQALTCRPHNIMVTACSNADCSTTYTGGTSTLTITPGGSPISFTGSTTTTLAIRTAQIVTLGIANASPSASSDLLCRVDGGAASTNCSLEFAGSGLLVEAPDLLARETKTLYISAVRKDTSSLECVPAFADVTREVLLWTKYLDPAPDELIGSPKLRIDITGDDDPAISTNAANPSLIELDFDPAGQASLPIRYDDAGQLQLNARYLGSATTQDSGLTMTGHGDFVSRPYGFHISIKDQGSSCTAATVEDCEALEVNGERLMAGDPFDLQIRAVAWQRDDEPRTGTALHDNPTTPNFQLNGMRLNSLQALPAAGEFEYLNPAGAWVPLTGSYEYNHTAGSMTFRVRQLEVGIFKLGIGEPVVYFGQAIGGGEALIGRFTPAWLGVSSDARLEHACGSFSYQGQVVSFAGGHPAIRVTGYNRQGEETGNYDRGSFWQLPPPQREPYNLSGPAGDPRLGNPRLGDVQSLPAVADDAGDGSRLFEWREEGVRQADAFLWSMPVLASDANLPLDLNAGGGLLQLRVTQEQLTDLDYICYRGSDPATGACQDFVHAFGGTELRLGRLKIHDNSSNDETQELDLPYELQYLSGWSPALSGQDREAWIKSEGDSCSLPRLGSVQLEPGSFTGGLAATNFPNPAGSLEATTILGAGQPSGLIRLSAPNKQGSVLVSLSGLHGESPEAPWLLYNWKDHSRIGDELKPPMGKATFGVQSNQRPEIFRRELYR